MAQHSPFNGKYERSIELERSMEEGVHVNSRVSEPTYKDEIACKSNQPSLKNDHNACCGSIPFLQKLIAEALGTFFLIFAGCASAIVNATKDNVVTLPGMAIVWGFAVMAMVYAVGHISGAHLNPAVTVGLATCKRFPWKEVPAYAMAQLVGATLASGKLRELFGWEEPLFVGTSPSRSEVQSLVLEFIITFYLMFVISAVATDDRAVGQLAGFAIGGTILINVTLAGYMKKNYNGSHWPISGASMNPVRSLGPAIAVHQYKEIWIYIAGPISGAIAGVCAYTSIRSPRKPSYETTTTTARKDKRKNNPLFDT